MLVRCCSENLPGAALGKGSRAITHDPPPPAPPTTVSAPAQVTGWAAQMGWRPFPVDVAGFAFNASMLRNIALPLWPFECKIGHKVIQFTRLWKCRKPRVPTSSPPHLPTSPPQAGRIHEPLMVCVGESLFIEHLGLTKREQLEPIGDYCDEMYVLNFNKSLVRT